MLEWIRRGTLVVLLATLIGCSEDTGPATKTIEADQKAIEQGTMESYEKAKKYMPKGTQMDPPDFGSSKDGGNQKPDKIK